MMAKLLVLKSRILRAFERHYKVSKGIIRGFAVFFSLLIFSVKFPEGFFSDKLWMCALLSLVCAFAPDVVSIVAIVSAVGVEVWRISPVMTGGLCGLVIIFFLLFGRRTKQQWYILLSVPILSYINIGFMVPVIAALFMEPTIVPALVMGIVFRFSIEGVAEYTTTSQGLTVDEGGFAGWSYLVDYLFSNRLFYVALIAYVCTYLIVYMIRRLNIKYSSQIAILVGCVSLYTIEMISNIIWELELNLLVTTLMVIVTMIVSYIVQFFRLTLDYQGTRKLQFQDDEYYYYVTAIPKYSVAAEQTEVTKIVSDDDASDIEDTDTPEGGN